MSSNLQLATTKNQPHYGAILTLHRAGYSLPDVVKFVEQQTNLGMTV